MNRPFAEGKENGIQHFDRQLAALLGEDGEEEGVWLPKFDIFETEDAYVLTSDIPGITVEDLKVDYFRGRLHIKGLRRHDLDIPQMAYLRRERGFGWFERWFDFKQRVLGAEILTTYRSGVLTINVPKERRSWSDLPKIFSLMPVLPGEKTVSPKKNVRV